MATDAAPLEAADALARTPFFAGLSSVELDRLVPELEERRFAAGETVFSQGDPPDGLYLIRRSAAQVVVCEDGQREAVLAILGPPEYFGEMALVSAEARSATVGAGGTLEVWRLPPEVREVLLAIALLVLLALLTSLVLGIGPSIRLLALALFPISAQLGINHWIVGLTLIVAANQ